MLTSAVLVFVVALLIGLLLGKFSKPEPRDVVHSAVGSLAEIKRGEFSIQFTINPRGDDTTAEPAEFRISGPFELDADSKLPKAKVQQTVSAGGQEQSVTLITTGEKGYIEIEGKAYELPADAQKSLTESTEELRKSGGGKSQGLAGLDIDFNKWLTDPKLSDGRNFDGEDTWKVESPVDIVAAIRDLLKGARALGGATGGQVPNVLSGTQEKELRDAVKRAYVEIFAGKDDELLRRVNLTMDIDTPKGQTNALGLAGGRLDIAVEIRKPNQPVTVETPENPLPAGALRQLQRGTSK